MVVQPNRYRSDEKDSARWVGFPFRDGDIVISARSKSGTTWMQMICALLVLETRDLAQPLANPPVTPVADRRQRSIHEGRSHLIHSADTG